ncbi:hypothetical protein JXA40_00120 [bacterium]|nr:hypothetical protein [candidate division CSSED10-310 bacterium]
MTRRGTGPNSIDEILGRFIEGFSVNAARRLLELNVLWRKIAKDPLAGQSCITGVDRRRSIVLEVDDFAWIKPLQQAEKYILKQLCSRSEGRHDYSGLIITQRKAGQTAAGAGKTGPVAPAAIPVEVVEAAQVIRDPDVREAFLRMVRNRLDLPQE